MKKIRRYSELITISDYIERFKYLKLGSKVGIETFGSDRYLNQYFYKTEEWRQIRKEVIIRDGGFDMGMPGYPIMGQIYIHHITPVTEDDLLNRSPLLLDPDNLISVSLLTHNAIHYSDESLLPRPFIERQPNDTVPWR